MVPSPHERDPAAAVAAVVLADPSVPDGRRTCGACGAAVGRGRTAGFCVRCGARYSFAPELAVGEVVGGRYEVAGCLAYGGHGWVHLALDRSAGGRWVVLKALRPTGSAAVGPAADSVLAGIDHPHVVRVHGIVRHGGARSVDYLVTSYADGPSLSDVLRAARAAGRPGLPLREVVAHGLDMLAALGYLHGRGLLYCDLKPDNAIRTAAGRVQLVDLGAVRPLHDPGAGWGTAGYRAPEVAAAGPSITSDLYTVGRTLAVLSFPFDFTRSYAHRLPDAAGVPSLAECPAFARLLLRATDPDPGRRFSSAAELGTALARVLESAPDADAGPGPSANRRTGDADPDHNGS